MHARASMCMHTGMCECACLHMWQVHTCINVCMYVYACGGMYVGVCVGVHACVSSFQHVCAPAYIYVLYVNLFSISCTSYSFCLSTNFISLSL